jgi:hypothetical protein
MTKREPIIVGTNPPNAAAFEVAQAAPCEMVSVDDLPQEEYDRLRRLYWSGYYERARRA